LLCSDKASRSIPAPDRGALSIACEVHSKHPSPVLDIGYCARQISFCHKQIGDWLAFEQEQLKEVELRKTKGEAIDIDFFASRIADARKKMCSPPMAYSCRIPKVLILTLPLSAVHSVCGVLWQTTLASFLS
jgi:hypothetical protein